MAVVEKYIDPNVAPGGDGSSGNPYSSPVEWDAAEATDLVTAGDQHIVYLRAGTWTGNLLLNTWTTSVANNITMKADTGHAHGGVLNTGFRWENTAAATSGFEIRQIGTVLEDFCIKTTTTANGSRSIYFNTADSANGVMRRMIIGPNRSGSREGVSIVGSNFQLESCLVFDNNNDGFYVANYIAATIKNLTVAKTDVSGTEKGGTGAAIATFHNVVSVGSGSLDFNDPGGKMAGTNNASGDATQPGTGGIGTIVQGDFTDYTNDDYTIASTSSQLYDAGDAANMASLDITGQPFTTNDIGCYAFVGAGGDPADVDIPSKQVHVQAFVPEIEAPFPADIDLPSKQVHVQAYAPQVQVPSGADVDLPSKQVYIQAFVPQVEAPFPANIDLPSKFVHIQAFAPQTQVPTGVDVDLPSKQVHVQAYAPQVEVPTDVDVDLPSKFVHVQAFAPMVVTGEEEISLLPTQYVHIQSFDPQVEAPAAVDVNLPSKQIHVRAFPPIVQTVSDVFINLPSKQVHVQAFAPTIDVNQPIFVDLPFKQVHIQAFSPRVQAGVDKGNTLWEAIEQIKMYIKPQIEALGLTQIMWPNLPIKRNSKLPFVQIQINVEDRELADIGGVHRTIGNLVTMLHTPYGNDAGSHNKYVDGLMKMVSNNHLNNYILFFSSIPTTVGRRDSWWVTGVETEFYLENV